MSLDQLPKDELKEMSFIELTEYIFLEKKQPFTFQELLKEIQSYLEISDEEVKARMIQFYTDLNIDGRFIHLGENRWGMRAWYPVDQIEEETVTTVKTRKKKSKAAVEHDLEDLDDLEEEEIVDELEDLEIIDDDDLDADLDDEDEDEFEDDLVEEDEDYDLDEDLDEDEDFEEDEEEL
ncbi:MAG TPA: DNA-directed RNA polymerase subunit delta [Chondromyces sp.]|nr:DNA-directed RNA polymerase subunit delta [Chondromyces sp.]